MIGKKTTLIEYAAFFGSIQIIQYLKYSKVPLTYSLWIYGVHSNNPEMIHFLEENEIKLKVYIENYQQSKKQPDREESTLLKNKPDITYERVYAESIICHHNEIADYIRDNFLYQTNNLVSIILNCFNYNFIPDDIGHIICESKSLNDISISQICFSMKQITIPSSVTSKCKIYKKTSNFFLD